MKTVMSLPRDYCRNKITTFMFVLMSVIIITSPTYADWINLTGAETAPNIAEITVLDDRVHIALEIYIDNAETFNPKSLQVALADGSTLSSHVKLTEQRMRKDRASPFAGMINPLTRKPVPEAPKDKRVVYTEIEYPFEGQPENLTFIPPTDVQGRAAFNIGFLAYHKTVPIIDFRYLGQPATLHLNWDDPWYSKFENQNLSRHHNSPLMAFLYIEPREVRYEALVRVRNLQEWTDLGLDNDAIITPKEQTAIKERAAVFFAIQNPVIVDSEKVDPIHTRTEFLTVSMTGIELAKTDKNIDLTTAILGIIVHYPIPSLPQKVTAHWKLFNDKVQRIPANVIDPVGPFKTIIEARDPILEWQNFLLKYKEPKVMPVMQVKGFDFGQFLKGVPSDEKALKAVEGILNSVNAAFIEKEKTKQDELLRIIVDDTSLNDISIELRRALAIPVAGGGVAQVDEVSDISLKEITELEGRKGFRTLASWNAIARGSHWGHLHQKSISFRALMEVISVNDHWKLAGITVIEAKVAP